MWITFSALPETCISEDAWIVRWSQTQAPLPGQEGELMFDRSQIVGRGRPEQDLQPNVTAPTGLITRVCTVSRIHTEVD